MAMIFRKAKKNFERVFAFRNLAKPTEEENRLIEELRRDVGLIFEAQDSSLKIWNDFQWKIFNKIMKSDPRNFLNWKIIRSLMFTAEDRLIEFKTLHESIHWNKWKMAIKEDSVGNPVSSVLYKLSSPNLIYHAYSLHQLLDKTNLQIETNVSKIFEFGGGYGGFCRMVYKFGFKGNYIIYDLPVFSALQKYFLKSTEIPLTVSTTTELERDSLSVALITEKSGVLSNSHILKETNLFVALWSLSESPLNLREKIIFLCNDIDYFLIAYQENFNGINNREYFQELKTQKHNYNWMDYEIPHLRGNRYLIGWKKP